jgi:hemerythrin
VGMQFFKWEDKYSVGDIEIDLQHQELFRILNKMFGIFGKATKQELSVILDDMVDYTSFHFNAEEQLLQKHPNFAEHKEEHETFIKKTTDLLKTLKESDQEISKDILSFLLSWLKNHIMQTDKIFFNDMK